MTRMIADADLKTKLANLDDVLEVCDEAGKTLGYFHPADKGAAVPDRPRSPFSDEELRRRQQQRQGRPLSEILKGLAGT